MLVEFISINQDQQVTLLLPHPASEDPVVVTMVLNEATRFERSLPCIYIEIAEFAQEVCKLPDGWEGKVSFSSLEDDFVILCRAHRGDAMLLEFTLESSTDEGNWLANVSFEVSLLDLQTIAVNVASHVKQC